MEILLRIILAVFILLGCVRLGIEEGKMNDTKKEKIRKAMNKMLAPEVEVIVEQEIQKRLQEMGFIPTPKVKGNIYE